MQKTIGLKICQDEINNMANQILHFFNLEGLIKNLNSSMAEHEEDIVMGEFIQERPRENPFHGLEVNAREVIKSGKYILNQTDYNGISGLLGIDNEISLGEIVLEKGLIGIETTPSAYESINFKIYQPINLKNGLKIPVGSCKYRIVEGHENPPLSQREDYVKKAGLFLAKANLTRVLPSDWLLNSRTEANC